MSRAQLHFIICKAVNLSPEVTSVTPEQVSANLASPVVLHSQIVLLTRLRPRAAVATTTEEYESLWMKVNRIYEQYIQSERGLDR